MKTFSKYIAVLLALLVALTAAPAFAGGSASAPTTTATGYRNFKYGKKIENQVWKESGEAIYQKSDGSWRRVDADGVETPTQAPTEKSWLEKWRPKIQHTVSEGSTPFEASVAGIGDSRNGADVLGVAGKANHQVVIGEEGFKAKGNLDGRAYLAQVRFQVQGKAGDEDANIGARLSGDAFVGAEGSADGELTVTSSQAALAAGVSGFAGAKGVGRLPIAATLCAMSVVANMAGEVSYGIGGKASGLISIDWSNLTAKVSGELAATLGLGLGAGASVKVNLGALLKDTQGTLDCLNDKLAALGRGALDLGGSLVDSAGSAIQGGLTGLGNLLKRGLGQGEPDTAGAADVVTGIITATSSGAKTCPVP